MTLDEMVQAVAEPEPTAPPADLPLAIETRGLVKKFGAQRAVDDLNLAVPRGTLYGLIGPNGAGKTTTLRMLAGLELPTHGSVLIEGEEVDARHAPGSLYRRVGYMPDAFGMYEDMRVWEYLDFFARCHRVPKDKRAQLVIDLLALVDLSAKHDADVNALSRGMKQRLCLAHALVNEPAVLLLDEPASGLDPRARLELRELLRELRAMGRTLVVSSHILPELADMCDAVGIMERGRLLASGKVADLERQTNARQTLRLELVSPLPAALEILAGLANADVMASSVAEGDEDAAEPGDGAWIELTLRGDARSRAELLATLVRSGVLVSACVPSGGSLEDLFMHVTKGEVA